MTDSFLQSMTFSRAGHLLSNCDCEECESMPPSIRKFVQERKRKRMLSGPIKRTQQRILVSRCGRISVWCMQMPKYAEPLVEFGGSHRIVWIKQLAKGFSGKVNKRSILSWIGKGIIGSSDEEKSRTKLIEWTEGDVFLVPSNGGKAIGWINTSTATPNDNDAIGGTNITDEGDGFAVLYVAKIPFNLLEQGREESIESNQLWANQLVECCRDGLKSCEKQSNKTPLYYKFPLETSKLLKESFRLAEGMTAKSDAIERQPKRLHLDQVIA